MLKSSFFIYSTFFFIYHFGIQACGFIPQVSSRSPRWVQLFSTSDKESEDDRKQRMELVRNLQDMYYKDAQSDTYTFLDETTGVIKHLPLWRVQWTELPGRSNVLNVHDPIYTNMFETILNRPKPWYFGHLYVPNGSKNLRSGEYAYELKNWRDDAKFLKEKDPKSRTAVVGTLMQISDFRRLQDGRLCLLVLGLERFVVKNAIQNLPYSVADVQILPDFDQLPQTEREDTAKITRAQAIQELFRYQAYEFDEVLLPLAKTEKYMAQTEVYGSWLVDLLPFAPYNFDENNLPTSRYEYKVNQTSSTRINETKPSLEAQLLENNVIRRPPSYYKTATPPEENISNDELEQQLWNALEDYCGATGTKIHPDIACLLPPDRSLPAYATPNTKQLSRDYPDYRRQRRFSFAASALLESIAPKDLQLRQVWLETPSTQERFFSVLQWFDLVNAQILGEFQ